MKYNNFLLHHLSVYYMLMACFYYSLTGVFAKLLGAQISSLEVVLFRNLPGLLILLYKIKARPRTARFANKGGHPFTLAFRGIIGILGLMVFFYNVANISLGEAFTFQKTASIWTAIIAYFTLGEKFGAMGWFSVCLGFVGIVLVIQPQFGLQPSDIFGILSGLFAAMAFTSVRGLRKYYSSDTIILSALLAGTLMPVALMIAAEFIDAPALSFMLSKFKIPNAQGWLFAVLLGLLGLFYQTYVTKAYAATRKAGIVATISYADIIFSTLFGLLLGDALPGFMALSGMALIIAAGALVANRK